MSKSAHPVAHRALIHGAVVLGCAAAILRTLYMNTFDGAWIPVERALSMTADPPWNHRVLFVWIARAFDALRPLTPFQAYFASQILAALLALLGMLVWVSRFVAPRDRWLGPVLLTVILLPTFTYRTFFDLGIVATFAFGFHFLYARQPLWLLCVVVLGTLNHEVTLLLIPVFAWVALRRREPRAWLAGWTLAQLGAYVGVRVALQVALPAERLWQSGKPAYNAGLIRTLDPALLFGMGVLVFWFLVVALTWKRLPRDLQSAGILFPLMLVQVFLFGQLNEPRVFDAAMPALVAMILTALLPRGSEGPDRP